jgi:hypothetical protein
MSARDKPTSADTPVSNIINANVAEKLADEFYSDQMDSAVTSFATVGYLQEGDGSSRSGEDFIRGQISAAIKAFFKEIPRESDLVRLARPPAPNGNGTTVGAQPVARLSSNEPDTPVSVGDGWKLVPIKATPEMLKAARIASRNVGPLGNWLGDYQTAPIYEAMLAASPTPPVKPMTQDERDGKLPAWHLKEREELMSKMDEMTGFWEVAAARELRRLYMIEDEWARKSPPHQSPRQKAMMHGCALSCTLSRLTQGLRTQKPKMEN